MTPNAFKAAARPETVALTREQIEDIFYAQFCMDRGDADKFWDAAHALQAG